MAIVKYDEPVKRFAEKLAEEMNAALQKELDAIVEQFVKKAEPQIKLKAKELAIKGGAWIMNQAVIMPYQHGYEVRIFVLPEKPKDAND